RATPTGACRTSSSARACGTSVPPTPPRFPRSTPRARPAAPCSRVAARRPGTTGPRRRTRTTRCARGSSRSRAASRRSTSSRTPIRSVPCAAARRSALADAGSRHRRAGGSRRNWPRGGRWPTAAPSARRNVHDGVWRPTRPPGRHSPARRQGRVRPCHSARRRLVEIGNQFQQFLRSRRGRSHREGRMDWLVFVRALHVLAASCWLGEVLVINLILVPTLSSYTGAARRDFLATVFPRVFRLASVLAGTVAVTGALLLYRF